MIERAQAVAAAHEWLDAWNAHDPERVVAHFRTTLSSVDHSPVSCGPGRTGIAGQG